MNPLEQLHDIHGLMPVSWLPLAPGWWVIIGIFLLLLIFLLGFLIYRRRVTQKKSSPDWRESALTEWTRLTTESLTPRERLNYLAILLRRIGMQRYGRQTCAGLSGELWLTWLTAYDPQGFDWQQNGQLLIQIPYMPPDTVITEEQLHDLYQAVHAWIIT